MKTNIATAHKFITIKHTLSLQYNAETTAH